jgi:hypothetical protein
MAEQLLNSDGAHTRIPERSPDPAVDDLDVAD